MRLQLIPFSISILLLIGCGRKVDPLPIVLDYVQELETYETTNRELPIIFSNPNPYSVLVKPSHSSALSCKCDEWTVEESLLPAQSKVLKNLFIDLQNPTGNELQTWTVAKKLVFGFEPTLVRYSAPAPVDVKVDFRVKQLIEGERQIYSVHNRLSESPVEVRHELRLLAPIEGVQLEMQAETSAITEWEVNAVDKKISLRFALDCSNETRLTFLPMQLVANLDSQSDTSIPFGIFFEVRPPVELAASEVIVHRDLDSGVTTTTPQELGFMTYDGYAVKEASDRFVVHLKSGGADGLRTGSVTWRPAQLAEAKTIELECSCGDGTGDFTLRIPVRTIEYSNSHSSKEL